MKTISRRISPLEEKFSPRAKLSVEDRARYWRDMTVVLVAFHVGKWKPRETLNTALERAFRSSHQDFELTLLETFDGLLVDTASKMRGSEPETLESERRAKVDALGALRDKVPAPLQRLLGRKLITGGLKFPIGG
jgi:hypothetical protein